MLCVELTESRRKVLQQVNEFLAQELSPDVADEFDPMGIFTVFGSEALKKFTLKLGRKHWLLPWLPEEWGGLNFSQVDTLLLNNTLLERGAIAPLLLMNTGTSIVGPALYRIGNDEQKMEYIPKIARGEIDFSVGYTEPEAGTDMASVRMSAKDDGDYFIVNGQKRFQTTTHCADYHWLLVRTDPSAPKHKGLTLLIVDLKSPGITIKPMWVIGDERTNEVFYDNVRVPKRNVVGQVNRGFLQVMTALQFERSFPAGGLKWVLDRLIEFARQKGITDDPIVSYKLANLSTELEVAYLFSYRLASIYDEGKIPTYEASMIKIFTSELYHRMLGYGLQIMSPSCITSDDPEWGRFFSQVQTFYQRSMAGQIGGGTNDMLRSYMMTRGFGIPPAW